MRGLRSENARQGAEAAVERDADRLVFGEEGREVGRREVDLGGFGGVRIAADVSGGGLRIGGRAVTSA